ncbi:MAG: hypothetical protein ACMUHX_06750 [bacterium]
MYPFKKRKKRVFDFFELGFHGDKYLLELVNIIIPDCNYFMETGTNVGSTLAYVGRNYDHVKCLSCEPDTEAFNNAIKNTSGLANISIYNESSLEFILRIKLEYTHLFNKNVLFWLDSHGYGFKWPIKEEISFITANFKSPYILIDDFKVPGLDCFGYDEYSGQECSFDYIKDALNPNLSLRLYYPIYTERTSRHHPLRGWGLIEFGHTSELKIPDSLLDKIQYIDINNYSEKDR